MMRLRLLFVVRILVVFSWFVSFWWIIAHTFSILVLLVLLLVTTLALHYFKSTVKKSLLALFCASRLLRAFCAYRVCPLRAACFARDVFRQMAQKKQSFIAEFDILFCQLLLL